MSTHSPCVFVVRGDPDWTRTLTEGLDLRGAAVHAGASVEELVRGEWPCVPELVVMPAGKELSPKFKETFCPRVPVLVISGPDSDGPPVPEAEGVYTVRLASAEELVELISRLSWGSASPWDGCSDEELALLEQAMQDGPAPSPKSRPLVVCVDDEPRMLAALQRTLRQESFEVVTTDDPFEALELMRRREVDVIVADLRMPSMDGTELLQLVGERSPSTARAMLTAYVDSATIEKCHRLGIQRLLSKPCTEPELCTAIKDMLDARQRADGFLDLN